MLQQARARAGKARAIKVLIGNESIGIGRVYHRRHCRNAEPETGGFFPAPAHDPTKSRGRVADVSSDGDLTAAQTRTPSVRPLLPITPVNVTPVSRSPYLPGGAMRAIGRRSVWQHVRVSPLRGPVAPAAVTWSPIQSRPVFRHPADVARHECGCGPDLLRNPQNRWRRIPRAGPP